MDSQWLKTQFRLNPDKTKADLARRLGLEPPAVSKILNGTRQIKAQEYAAMRSYFGLPVDGAKAAGDSYVLTHLCAGGLSEDNGAKNGDSEWIIPGNILSSRTQAPPEKIKIFKIDENIMAPDFCRGEHVVVDLSDAHPSPPGIFIVSDGFSYLVRMCEYIPNTDPAEVRVGGLKTGFEPQVLKSDDIKMIGRVIAKLQFL